MCSTQLPAIMFKRNGFENKKRRITQSVKIVCWLCFALQAIEITFMTYFYQVPCINKKLDHFS